MPLPDVVPRVAELAVGRPVTVFVSGKSYALPLALEPASIAPPDPLQELSTRLLASDAETRAVASAASERATAAMNDAMKELAVSVTDANAKVAQAVESIYGALHLPVKPVYDKAGKLIGALRAKKEGA